MTDALFIKTPMEEGQLLTGTATASAAIGAASATVGGGAGRRNYHGIDIRV